LGCNRPTVREGGAEKSELVEQSRAPGLFTGINKVHLVLFEMNDMIIAPYLAAIDRILISAMPDPGHARVWKRLATKPRALEADATQIKGATAHCSQLLGRGLGLQDPINPTPS
jgi:hypothetical protein